MTEPGSSAPSVAFDNSAPGERLPGASFASLSSYLAALEGAGLSSSLKQPPGMSKPTWERVRASLTALDLVGADLRPTIQLRRLARGERTLIEVLESRFPSLVPLIEAGDSEALASELERSSPHLAQSGRERFESLVRGALLAAGRSPRLPGQRTRKHRPGAPLPPPSDVHPATTEAQDELIRQEADVYLRWIDEALRKGDVDLAAAIRNRLLSQVYESMSRDPRNSP